MIAEETCCDDGRERTTSANECIDYDEVEVASPPRSRGNGCILNARTVSLNAFLAASIHTDDLLVVEVAWYSASS